MSNPPPFDLYSFITGACCMVLALYVAGKWQDYLIRRKNRKEIEQRWAAYQRAKYITDYDKVAQAAIADLLEDCDKWQKETK